LTISPLQREIEKGPVPVSRADAAFVRLAHPHIYGLFYCNTDPINPWVKQGYTRWPIHIWEGMFGAQVQDGDDQEGRKWEFFGYVIPLYDDKTT